MPERMRAVLQQAFGGPEVLELAEVDRPVPLATEVLVRVKAVGVNPVEPIIRSGQFPLIGQPPFILGWDVSGVVEDLEPGVTRFEPGDEVYGMPLFPRAASAYAEYVTAPSRQLARKPVGLSHAEAAVLPLAGLTAWQSLVDTAQLTAGQRVLVHGAGGGVGHLAVQVAKARGAYVIGTASAAKHEFVRGLGADEVIDYQASDFAAMTGDLDVVLDTIGGDIARRSIGVLRPRGLLVTIVGRRDADLAARTRAAGRRFAGISVEPDYPGLEALAQLAGSGKLRVHLQTTLPLAEAARAHELLESGRTTGKIALSLQTPPG
jgi:NADPH:quinone reductase-like Zn-dependent oxidoreductase